MNKKNESPYWWRVIRIMTLLPFPLFPFVWMASLMLFDQSDHYWSKMFIIIIIDAYPLYILLLNRWSLHVYKKNAKIMQSLLVYSIPIIVILLGTVWFHAGPMPSSELEEKDIRNYWFTPAYGLACSIADNDTLTIHTILRKSPKLIKYKIEYHNESLLFFAFKNRKFEALKILIQCGANPNELGNDGKTILHLLCMEDDAINNDTYQTESIVSIQSIICWLLEHGANPNLKTDGTPMYKYGPRTFMTPLQALCYYGPDNSDILNVLIAHGAKMGNEKEWQSMIEAAKMRGHNRVSNALLNLSFN